MLLPIHIKTISKINLLFLFSFLFTLLQPSTSDAQIFEKIKNRVKKEINKQEKKAEALIDNAITCIFDDKECIEEAQDSGKTVVLTDKNGEVLKDGKGHPVTAVNTENIFKRNTKVEKLGMLDERNPQYKISPDGAHVALPGFEGSRQIINVDGEKGSVFDEVFFNTFTFSPQNGRFAYFARRGSECFAIVDHKESGRVDCNQNQITRALKYEGRNGLSPFHFNEKGTVVAYLKQTDRMKQLWQVVINSKEGPPVFARQDGPKIYIRGDNVYYATELSSSNNGIQQAARVFVNNKPGPPFVSIDHLDIRGDVNLLISDDGKKYVYVGTDSADVDHLVVNGKPHADYNEIGRANIEPHSGNLFYTARSSETWRPEGAREDQYVTLYISGNQVYKNTEVGNAYNSHSLLALSKKGNRHAFVTRQRGSSSLSTPQTVRYDGKRSRDYKDINNLMFTADGKKLIFSGQSNYKNFLVVEGKELGPYDRLEQIQVSETGGTYAFRAEVNGTKRWYVNGKQVGPDDGSAGNLTLSKNGRRYALSGSPYKSDAYVFVNDKMREHWVYKFQHSSLLLPRPVRKEKAYNMPVFNFSENGDRLTYVIRIDRSNSRKVALVLDGKTIDTVEGGFSSPAFSPSGKNFAYLKHEETYGTPLINRTLYINGKPGPIVGNRMHGMKNTISFLDNSTICVIGFMGNEVIRHTIKI